MVINQGDQKSVSDDTTAAGPAVFQFQKAIATGNDTKAASSASSTGSSNGAAGMSNSVLTLIASVVVGALMFV